MTAGEDDVFRFVVVVVFGLVVDVLGLVVVRVVVLVVLLGAGLAAVEDALALVVAGGAVVVELDADVGGAALDEDEEDPPTPARGWIEAVSVLGVPPLVMPPRRAMTATAPAHMPAPLREPLRHSRTAGMASSHRPHVTRASRACSFQPARPTEGRGPVAGLRAWAGWPACQVALAGVAGRRPAGSTMEREPSET